MHNSAVQIDAHILKSSLSSPIQAFVKFSPLSSSVDFGELLSLRHYEVTV